MDKPPQPTVNTHYVADKGNLDWINYYNQSPSPSLLETFKSEKNLSSSSCCAAHTGPELLIHMYTHNQWYTAINNIIGQKQSKYYPLVHEMTNWIASEHNASDTAVLFRGLNGVELKDDDMIFEFADFTSWSASQDKAATFAKGGIILKIRKTDKVVARDVSGISRYPDEKEYLSIPFSYVGHFKYVETYKGCKVYACQFVEPLDPEYAKWQMGVPNKPPPPGFACIMCCVVTCCSPIFVPLVLVMYAFSVLMCVMAVVFAPLYVLLADLRVVDQMLIYVRRDYPVAFSLKERFFYFKMVNSATRWKYFWLWVTMVYNVFFITVVPFIITKKILMRMVSQEASKRFAEMDAQGNPV